MPIIHLDLYTNDNLLHFSLFWFYFFRFKWNNETKLYPFNNIHNKWNVRNFSRANYIIYEFTYGKYFNRKNFREFR